MRVTVTYEIDFDGMTELSKDEVFDGVWTIVNDGADSFCASVNNLVITVEEESQ